MKFHLTALVLFIIAFANAQEKEERQAVYLPCIESDSVQDCLYSTLQQKIVSKYDQRSLQLIADSYEQDTLLLRVALAVQEDGSIDRANSDISSCDAYIDGINSEIVETIGNFEPFVDSSGQPLADLLHMKLYFVLSKNDALRLQPLPDSDTYFSGKIGHEIIEEVPVFPGCEGSTDKKLCFQQKMQEHIRTNFRYPRKAQKKKISGRVINFFIVDKDGSVAKLRTFGAHPILMEESRRFMALLPRMRPGKQKGRPVRVPFAIPLTFALR